ncbi:hypothetical protein LJC74_08005 [Eubacteriales bacterium OttesenSCG-928-A19]|nr:hypothetical protein [Eubacteriales bacterium OttesenSCG-928-A19]
MVGGVYQVAMITTMGKKRGTLTLHADDGVLSGRLFIMGVENRIESGHVDAEHCIFSGCMQTQTGEVRYTIDCNIDGDQLTGVAKTSKGDMRFTGLRQTEQTERTNC